MSNFNYLEDVDESMDEEAAGSSTGRSAVAATQRTPLSNFDRLILKGRAPGEAVNPWGHLM